MALPPGAMDSDNPNSKDPAQCSNKALIACSLNTDLECHTTTTSIVVEQNQRSLPAFPPYRGNHGCGRYHSFSIPSSNQQPPPNPLVSEKRKVSKRSWKRSSAASTCSKAATICYGYASASYPFQVHELDEDEYSPELNSIDLVHPNHAPTARQDERNVETGELDAVEAESQREGKTVGQEEEGEEDDAIFFTRLSDGRILPIYCSRPTGHRADQFIQSLSERQRNCLRQFMEAERPVEGEAYIWVREDATMKTTVLAIAALENHLKLGDSQHSQVRRVNWRHLSMDKVSVYRYSIPQITTKFRLRVANFLSRNYRCCILCVWCLVIALISVGIVLSVVFGSVPQGSGKASGAPENTVQLPPSQHDRSKRNLVIMLLQ